MRSKVFNSDYAVFRRDRSGRRDRGVFVAVQVEISYGEEIRKSDIDLELLSR